MPKFEISANGKKYEITAPDQASAVAAFGQFSGAPPAPEVNMSVTDAFARKTKVPPPAPERPNLLNSTAATVNGLVASVPGLQTASDALLGAGGMLLGKDYGETVRGLQRGRERIAEAAPLARLAGEVAPMFAVPAMAPKAFGLTGTMPQRLANSVLSTAGYEGVKSIGEGDQGAETLLKMGVGGAGGFAGTLAGKGAELAGKGAGALLRPITRAFNQDNAAIKAVSNNIVKDTATAPRAMGSAEEAALAKAGGETMNIDRFGDGIRRLGRAAANVSTDAGNVLRTKAQERFQGQGARAQTFLKNLMNGATDDLALQDSLNEAAKRANSVNYDKAYNAPAARAVWNQPIKDLMQSDTFQSAIKMAEKRGTDRAAVAGVRAVRNPFEFRPDGSVTLRQNADGTRALPSLQFWDQVKRNIDGMIGTAKRQGDNTLVADLTQIKTKLTGALDAAVPDYKKARGVAASFFGADDAIDAGRKAAKSSRSNPEIGRAVMQMTPAERDAFSVGFTSEIMDALSEKTTRVNVINQMFDSPAAKERFKIALGPQKAKELEAYVKAEQIIDQARVALSGNSTTAQQLIDAGVVGGAGLGSYMLSGGDLTQAGGVAFLALAGRRGMALLGKRVDENVMKRVAEMLSSSDPADVQRAITNAAFSKQHMEAVQAIYQGVNLATRSAAVPTATTGG
jgi:hypothetical protein